MVRVCSIFKKTFSIFILFLLFSISSSAEVEQFKLAIVDVGQKEKIPVEFIDLVYLSFKKYPEIILLERMEIEKILKEHAINKSFSVKELIAGKFLATDGFLMLEIDKLKGRPFLRIRLVETKYGFKLFDTSIPFPLKKAEYKILAEKISKIIREKVKKIREIKEEKLIVVGISFIRSEEISKKWEWLSNAITTGIEQTMNLYPGVILLERMRTRTLKEEREIVSKLPESLKSSSLFIDGSFKVERKKGEDVLWINIRCRSIDGRTLYKKRVKGRINKLNELYKKICEEIIKITGIKKEDIKPINSEIESEILADSAEFYLINDELEKAISLAEASVSLCPNSINYNRLLLTIYAKYLKSLTRGYGLYGSLASISLVRKKEIIKILFRCVSIIEHLNLMWDVRKHADPPTLTPYYFPYSGHREFFSIDVTAIIANCLKSLSPPPDELKSDFSELFQSYLRLKDLEWKFYEERCKFCEKRRSKFLCEFKKIMLRKLTSHLRILPLFPNVDEAILFARDIFNKSSRLYKEMGLKFNWKIKDMCDYEGYFNLDRLCDIFIYPEAPEWAKKEEAKNKVGRFLEECFKKTDYLPLKVYLAYKCHYFFSKVMKDDEKTKEYEEIYKILKKSLSKKRKNIPRKQKHISLEKENKIETQSEISQYKIIKILSLDKALKLKNKVSGSPSFRRLIFDNNSLKGIVYSISFYKNKKKMEKFGIIKLDEDFSILNIIESPFETKPFYWALKKGYNWPSFICHNGNIYLGLHGNGMLIFYKDGKVELINEDNGLSSNDIMKMKLLKNGKIYALVGGNIKRGLMEFDPKTKNSRIIFSTCSLPSEEGINGKFILNITESEDREKLWIATYYDYKFNIYLYDPKNNKIINLLKNFPHEDKCQIYLKSFLVIPTQVLLSEMDGKLIIGGCGNAAELDIEKKKVSFLFMRHSDYQRFEKWKEFFYPPPGEPLWLTPKSIDGIKLVNILFSEDGIIAIGYENKIKFSEDGEKIVICGGRRKLYYFRKGRRVSEEILKKEKFLSIVDAFITKKGLFILTDQYLYLLPEIKK